MKNPLHYQSTEYDCGPTSLVNAFMYLFDREVLPPELIHKIYQMGTDRYGASCHANRGGTTRHSMHYIADWFNTYAEVTHFPVECRYISGPCVNLSPDGEIASCLKDGGVAVVRCFLDCDHYILLTGLEGSYVKVFDPYFEEDGTYDGTDIQMVSGHPCEYNRLVPAAQMDLEEPGDYTFSCWTKRHAVLIRRTGDAPELI